MKALVFVVPLLLLSGCTQVLNKINETPTPVDFEITGITAKQIQAAGPPPAIYQGTIYFPYCAHNPNEFEVKARGAFEVYQRRLGPDGEYLHLVKEVQAERLSRVPANGSLLGGISYAHDVLVNETAEGGFNYTIHRWHEILDPEPVHRWDHWYNLTFTPYQEEVYHEEGACDVF